MTHKRDLTIGKIENLKLGSPHALLVGMQIGAATMEIVWSFFKNLKMHLPYDPEIPLQVYIYEETPKY